MTGPATTPTSTAGTTDLREALAQALYELAPFPHREDRCEPMSWDDVPEWAKTRNRERADALITGPLATLRERAEAAEREQDEAHKATNRAKETMLRFGLRFIRRERLQLDCIANGKAQSAAAESRLATLAAENEALRAALTLCLTELDWQTEHSRHCGDPNHECPMQDIHNPDDGHLLARNAARALLAQETSHG